MTAADLFANGFGVSWSEVRRAPRAGASSCRPFVLPVVQRNVRGKSVDIPHPKMRTGRRTIHGKIIGQPAPASIRLCLFVLSCGLSVDIPADSPRTFRFQIRRKSTEMAHCTRFSPQKCGVLKNVDFRKPWRPIQKSGYGKPPVRGMSAGQSVDIP